MKRIKLDVYLKEFVGYCRNKFKDNLIGIAIYGSYAWGYFDKNKSDYDIFVIFKDRIPKGKKEINKKFPKVTLQYFSTKKDIIDIVKAGSWSVYITLLKEAGILYETHEFKQLIKKLSKIDFLKDLKDISRMKNKARYEANVLKRAKGYKAIKWALPSIRKRLQFLTYIKTKKLVWDVRKNLVLNKDILTKEEVSFIINLDNKLQLRANDFNVKDKNKAVFLLDKLNDFIIKSIQD